MVAEETATDAVTGETIAATDEDDGVLSPIFFLFVMVCAALFGGAPRFRFFNHPVINLLFRVSCLPIVFLGIVGGFSVSR